ncbi:hypothetical protein [Pelomonas cellulosilytica]|uniref:Uncharacterized protein n=1 Tax=Pelomonas cellulosilytica TaxID=2906762 RepID=A0ABS8XY35_9BURK|nr:hypothetical protein [Pelomonas sp. P8]MCE4556853.1 hypothetical protein [Pelomonas sp. P8]
MTTKIPTLNRLVSLTKQPAKQATQSARQAQSRRHPEAENSQVDILSGLEVVESDWAAWEDTVATWAPRSSL